jgi:hypothetical protein
MTGYRTKPPISRCVIDPGLAAGFRLSPAHRQTRVLSVDQGSRFPANTAGCSLSKHQQRENQPNSNS